MSETTDETRADDAAPVDTSREAVERMASGSLFVNGCHRLLMALLAERDAARAEASQRATEAHSYLSQLLERERASALAARMAAEAREDARYAFLRTRRARHEGAAAALEALRDRLGGCDG